MVDVVVDTGVVVGKKIAGVEVVDEDYLMVVEVEQDCSMNVHAHFNTHHQLDFIIKFER